jgi:hypothetical protein
MSTSQNNQSPDHSPNSREGAAPFNFGLLDTMGPIDTTGITFEEDFSTPMVLDNVTGMIFDDNFDMVDAIDTVKMGGMTDTAELTGMTCNEDFLTPMDLDELAGMTFDKDSIAAMDLDDPVGTKFAGDCPTSAIWKNKIPKALIDPEDMDLADDIFDIAFPPTNTTSEVSDNVNRLIIEGNSTMPTIVVLRPYATLDERRMTFGEDSAAPKALDNAKLMVPEGTWVPKDLTDVMFTTLDETTSLTMVNTTMINTAGTIQYPAAFTELLFVPFTESEDHEPAPRQQSTPTSPICEIPETIPAEYFTDESRVKRVPVNKTPYTRGAGTYPKELLINGLPLMSAAYIRTGIEADLEEAAHRAAVIKWLEEHKKK